MAAKYMFRLDDITPSMDWDKFMLYIKLFSKVGVKPLLGIVPDNRDKNIEVNTRNPEFWTIIKKLSDNDKVDIAQHGYQHKLFPDQGNSKRFVSAIPTETEFSGLSKDIQYNKILAGKKILESHGLYTNIWISPAHALDDCTLDVLNELGFLIISDGNTLYPFKYKNLLFIPQQFEKPRKFPIGVFTFCIHINNSSDHLYEATSKLLMSKSDCISFSYNLLEINNIRSKLFNRIFRLVYSIIRIVKNYFN